MDDIHRNIEEYNPNKKRKILTFFDLITANMLNDKKFNPIVTELFIRGRTLNIRLAFFRQSYSAVPKNISLNTAHYFIIKVPTTKDCINFCKNVLQKQNYFSIIDATLASGNPLHFRKNLLERIYKLILTIDDKMKNYSMTLTEKQQKYHYYHLEKLINMNILPVKKYYLLIKGE